MMVQEIAIDFVLLNNNKLVWYMVHELVEEV